MKTLRLLSFFSLIGCMLLVSCQKDNDENDPSQESIITRDEDGRFFNKNTSRISKEDFTANIASQGWQMNTYRKILVNGGVASPYDKYEIRGLTAFCIEDNYIYCFYNQENDKFYIKKKYEYNENNNSIYIPRGYLTTSRLIQLDGFASNTGNLKAIDCEYGYLETFEKISKAKILELTKEYRENPEFYYYGN